MKITVSGLIIEMIELLDENCCYEELYRGNSLLVTCKKHLIDAFLFRPFLCLHYCKRRHFVFYNARGCKTHPRDCKIVKCYACYRKCVKKLKTAFPFFIK